MDVKKFKGLNNVSDPMRMDMSWLVQADNVNVTNTGAITKRQGYTLQAAGVYTSAFSTFDFSRMYVSVAGEIRNFAGVVIYLLTSTAPIYWCEINNHVYFNNGTDSGVITAGDEVQVWKWSQPVTPTVEAVSGNLPAGFYQVRCTNVLADGRETGTSDPAEIYLTANQGLQISGLMPSSNVYIAPANSDVYQLTGKSLLSAFTFNTSPDDLGRDLLNAFLDPLPNGTDVIAAWKGRVYAAQYMASEDQTVVWFTEPMGFHLFNLNSNFLIIPGHVLMMAAHESALVIGTEQRVYAYGGDKIEQVADYGVVAGQHCDEDDDGRLLFWTVRGLCAALPFTNLTEKQVSVAPGVRAGGCLVRAGGQRRYLTVLQRGGSPFNPH
jgi:hypothetical protein